MYRLQKGIINSICKYQINNYLIIKLSIHFMEKEKVVCYYKPIFSEDKEAV